MAQTTYLITLSATPWYNINRTWLNGMLIHIWKYIECYKIQHDRWNHNTILYFDLAKFSVHQENWMIWLHSFFMCNHLMGDIVFITHLPYWSIGSYSPYWLVPDMTCINWWIIQDYLFLEMNIGTRWAVQCVISNWNSFWTKILWNLILPFYLSNCFEILQKAQHHHRCAL